MKLRELKPQRPRAVQIAKQDSETTRSLHAALGRWSNYIRRFKGALRLTDLLLFLQKLFGAMLGGIMVSIQIGNVLICASMLLIGPSIILDMVPK
jgi:hypothetical protein